MHAYAHGIRNRVVAMLMATTVAMSMAAWPPVEARPLPSPPAVETADPTVEEADLNKVARAKAEEAQPDEPSPVEIALATAREQLGKPYRWAATGPNAFDCSGFTSYVWRQAGVEIPRTSRSQFAGLPRVPLDELEPGDLVYSRGHIGLYIGDGNMIHSPHSGRTVEIAPLRKRVIGAVRPALLIS